MNDMLISVTIVLTKLLDFKRGTDLIILHRNYKTLQIYLY